MAEESLSLLIYGPAGSGKTTLGLSGPTPTLVLDAEQASKFIPRREKVSWDPLTEPEPPAYDGTWKYCVVRIDKWDIAEKVMKYIKTRKHPFKTILLDSVTEIVVKAKEEINGRNQFKVQHWGELSSNMGYMLRDLRDEASAKHSPIEVLCIIAVEQEHIKANIAGEVESRKVEPYLEGGVRKIISFLYDITAHITLIDELADRSNPGSGYVSNQYFFTGKNPEITAKSRVGRILPPQIVNPTLSGLLHGIFPPDEEPEPQPQPPVPEPVQEPQPPVPQEPVPEPKKTKSSGLPSLPTN